MLRNGTMSSVCLHANKIYVFYHGFSFKEIANAEGLEIGCDYGVFGRVRRELTGKDLHEVRIIIYGMISQWTWW